MTTKKNSPAFVHKAAIAMAFCISLLAGCTTLTAPEYAASTSQRDYIDVLELDGRLSAQYKKGEQDEAIHVSFGWKQRKDFSSITILSPLGQMLAAIEIRPDSAVLIQPGKPPRYAADVNALAEQALGWPLPVAGLRNWLQGFATNTQHQPFIASPTNTQVTTSDGWHLQYQSWQNEAAQMRPKRIDLERQTEQAGKVMIRIVLDTWQTH